MHVCEARWLLELLECYINLRRAFASFRCDSRSKWVCTLNISLTTNSWSQFRYLEGGSMVEYYDIFWCMVSYVLVTWSVKTRYGHLVSNCHRPRSSVLKRHPMTIWNQVLVPCFRKTLLNFKAFEPWYQLSTTKMGHILVPDGMLY